MSGEKTDAPRFTMSFGEEEEAWSCYCASYAGLVLADDSPSGWQNHKAAALAIGAQDRLTLKPPRGRSALLAEVARLCGEGEPADGDAYLAAYQRAQDAGAKDVLDKLERWTRGPDSNHGMAAVRGWIAAQRKAVAS